MKTLAIACLAVLLPMSQAWFFNFGSGRRQEAVGEISAECLQKAADGDCLFYTCFDERHPCEMNNWALSYGWRFCKRYDQMYSTFTHAGKQWMNNTRRCTMRAAIEFYNDSHINCKDAEVAMHAEYGRCTKEHGICNADLVMSNKESLLEIHTFSRHSLVRFLSYVRECGAEELDTFADWARNRSDVVRTYLESFSDRLHELIERDWSLPEIPEIELPEMPEIELPEMPEFRWPSFGMRWTDDGSSESGDEEEHLKIVGDD